MLDEATRIAILKLGSQGHGTRKIAQALGVARSTVRQVIDSGSAEVPALVRAELAEPHREQILELYARYQRSSGSSTRTTHPVRRGTVVLGADCVLPKTWHRDCATCASGSLQLQPG